MKTGGYHQHPAPACRSVPSDLYIQRPPISMRCSPLQRARLQQCQRRLHRRRQLRAATVAATACMRGGSDGNNAATLLGSGDNASSGAQRQHCDGGNGCVDEGSSIAATVCGDGDVGHVATMSSAAVSTACGGPAATSKRRAGVTSQLLYGSGDNDGGGVNHVDDCDKTSAPTAVVATTRRRWRPQR